ncbi:PAS domain-containing protein [Poseidonocella sp. HB161398]|uniref:PAS domain-containing protein n=1 Tax=Poseidonocella sp. HB161398 TaxID=2320855 RepID=UPI0014867A13|nr:PAS domain-containing protein [Poseidonocella sp. HB161398]
MSIASKTRQFILAARIPLTLADTTLPDVPLVLANAAFEALTGYDAAEVEGRNCRFLQGGIEQPEARDEIRAALAAGRELQVVLRNRRRDGSEFDNLLFMYPVGKGLFLGSQFELPRVARIVSSVARHQEIVGMANSLAEEIAGQRLKLNRNSSDALAQTVRTWMRHGR